MFQPIVRETLFDLWRVGTSKSPCLNSLEPTAYKAKNGQYFLASKSAEIERALFGTTYCATSWGLSSFSVPLQSKYLWKLPKGSKLPKDLAILQNMDPHWVFAPSWDALSFNEVKDIIGQTESQWVKEADLASTMSQPLIVNRQELSPRCRFLFDILEEKLLESYAELEKIDQDPSLEEHRAEVENTVQLFHCLLEPNNFRHCTITGPSGWNKCRSTEIPIEQASLLLKFKKNPLVHKAIAEKIAREMALKRDQGEQDELFELECEAHIQFLKVILIDMYA